VTNAEWLALGIGLGTLATMVSVLWVDFVRRRGRERP